MNRYYVKACSYGFKIHDTQTFDLPVYDRKGEDHLIFDDFDAAKQVADKLNKEDYEQMACGE